MEFRVPELGEGVYEAELVEWLVKAGQTVQRGDAVVEIMTDKATIELPSTFCGTIDALLVEAGETVAIGQSLLQYDRDGQEGELKANLASDVEHRIDIAAGQSSPVATTDADERPVSARNQGNGSSHIGTTAAPSVRRMARALGVDLKKVIGSGPDGRVLIADLGAFVRAHSAFAPLRAQRATPDVGEPGRRIPLHGLRRTIAENMVTAKRVIPHYSYIDECDVSNMVALRNTLKKPLYHAGIKLTNLPFYVKAVVGALKQVPLVNASLDDEAEEIVLHEQIHIGIATATTKGLVVPVIHDADQKDLAAIASDIERLVRAAQAGTIERPDLRGSTFTISSIGNFGGLVSTPIIHHPEVGIVAIGKIFKRPTYDSNGEIVPAQIVYLSFSFDHRVVDGSIGAMFGNAVIQQLQQPQSLADGISGL